MKSTNIIFYDNIGINELYGDFLTQMNLSLSDIVAAVKYVGQYLSYDTLKQFSFNNKSKQVNNRYGLHEHRLSLYQYNAEIYAGWKWEIIFYPSLLCDIFPFSIFLKSQDFLLFLIHISCFFKFRILNQFDANYIFKKHIKLFHWLINY